ESARASYSAAKGEESEPVRQAKQALATAKADEKAAQDTVANGGQADVDAATQARIDAEANLKQAQSQMNRNLGPNRDAVNMADRSLAAVNADAAKGIVRAPITGTVVELMAKPGLSATSGQPLVNITNFEAARVQGEVPPELKAYVVRDAKVIIALN